MTKSPAEAGPVRFTGSFSPGLGPAVRVSTDEPYRLASSIIAFLHYNYPNAQTNKCYATDGGRFLTAS